MTNMAMQYINYPAKTLMKSSRIVFTMIFGVVITRKKYRFMDYFVVLCMVAGLAIFMHADATSSAVFQPLGVIMLTVSLICDGAISNMSENIMKQYGVGQDEFIFRMYSIALVAITAAAAVKGDLQLGIIWMMKPGTYDEVLEGVPQDQVTWTVFSKFAVVVLFSSMGFFGSSCSAAITKNFGALTMSITSTARKATTLFLSFFLFNNVCTAEHIVGVIIFIAALTAKSLRRSKDPRSRPSIRRNRSGDQNDLEMQLLLDSDKMKQRYNARRSPPRSRGGYGRSPENRTTPDGTPGRRSNAASVAFGNSPLVL
jgi:adenosine 3'-phospho 5'-phosphosulfate transporter B3